MLRPFENFGLLFHKYSKDKSFAGRVSISKDPDTWPSNWKEVEYKTYKNSRQVSLKSYKDISFEKKLSDALIERISRRFEMANRKITFYELNTIISYSISEKYETIKRMYPSGGERYTLEFYFSIFDIDEIENGLYHYNVKENSLEFLKSLKKEDLVGISPYEWSVNAQVNIFITAIFERNIRKYGERGYRHCLIEAGHAAQNIYLVATALQVPVCTNTGTKDLVIEKILGIDGEHESFLFIVSI